MPKTYEPTILGTVPVQFSNLNSQYFAIFLDNNFFKNFVKRNRLTKQYDLRLGAILKKVGTKHQCTFCTGVLTDENQALK